MMESLRDIYFKKNRTLYSMFRVGRPMFIIF